MRSYITVAERELLCKNRLLVEHGIYNSKADWYVHLSVATKIAYFYKRLDAINMAQAVERSGKIARVVYRDHITSTGYLVPVGDERIHKTSIPDDLYKLLLDAEQASNSAKGRLASIVVMRMITRGKIFDISRRECSVEIVDDAKTKLSDVSIVLKLDEVSVKIQTKYDRAAGTAQYHQPEPCLYMESHERNYYKEGRRAV